LLLACRCCDATRGTLHAHLLSVCLPSPVCCTSYRHIRPPRRPLAALTPERAMTAVCWPGHQPAARSAPLPRPLLGPGIWCSRLRGRSRLARYNMSPSGIGSSRQHEIMEPNSRRDRLACRTVVRTRRPPEALAAMSTTVTRQALTGQLTASGGPGYGPEPLPSPSGPPPSPALGRGPVVGAGNTPSAESSPCSTRHRDRVATHTVRALLTDRSSPARRLQLALPSLGTGCLSGRAASGLADAHTPHRLDPTVVYGAKRHYQRQVQQHP